MIDKIIEFVVGIFILCIILVYVSPYIVDAINYIGYQLQRINF